MKIDIALSGCQMIKRMAEDYRVQFGCQFWEQKKKITVPLYLCLLHDAKALIDKHSLRARVNVIPVLCYVDLEDLHLFT